MIEDPLPSDWRVLQRGVCRLFQEIGLNADTEVELHTPRGTVTVDVFAVDEASVEKIRYIVECKNWNEAIPQTVVHAFTTVMHETGGNIGFIVAKNGLQSGAEGYTRGTNVQGVTYQELQRRYLPVWFRRHFCARVADAAEVMHEYVEPCNGRRDRAVAKLNADDQRRFYALQERYCPLGMAMWILDVPSVVSDLPHANPTDVEDYKERLAPLLGSRLGSEVRYFRDVLDALCAKLKAVENSFHELFGGNIFAEVE